MHRRHMFTHIAALSVQKLIEEADFNDTFLLPTGETVGRIVTEECRVSAHSWHAISPYIAYCIWCVTTQQTSQVRMHCIHETLLRVNQFDRMISVFMNAIDLASSLSSSNDVSPDFDNLSTWLLPHPGFIFRSQTVAAFFRGALVGHPAGSGDHRHVGRGEEAWLGLDYVLYLSVIYICIWDVLFMDYIRADERCTVCSACVIWNTSWHDAMIALFVKIPSTII